MAIYHLHVKNISRGDGRSVVAAAAYRAGAILPNEAEERESAFGGKRDVVFSEIRLCPGAPAWMADRARLWNAVEAREKRKDARLAKEIELALPRELSLNDSIGLVQSFADMYTSAGHVVDLAIHDDGTGNPHAHLLMTLRASSSEGLGEKLAAANALSFVTEARAGWSQLVNAALGKVGAGVQIDHRSLAGQGVKRPPATHRGPDAAERRRRRERRREAVREPIRSDAGAMPVDPAEASRSRNTTARERIEALAAATADASTPILVQAALALSDGDIAKAEATLERAESERAAELRRTDDMLPAPGPDGDLIPMGVLREGEGAMLAAMEHPAGPGAEARSHLAGASADALLPSPAADWLTRELGQGHEQLAAERAGGWSRGHDRER